MKIRKCTKMWTKADGTKVRVCDMTDSHLQNSLNWLELAHRGRIDDAWMGLCSLQGEMVSYYAEEDIDAATSVGVSYSFPIYDDMLMEVERRAEEKVAKPKTGQIYKWAMQ